MTAATLGEGFIVLFGYSDIAYQVIVFVCGLGFAIYVLNELDLRRILAAVRNDIALLIMTLFLFRALELSLGRPFGIGMVAYAAVLTPVLCHLAATLLAAALHYGEGAFPHPKLWLAARLERLATRLRLAARPRAEVKKSSAPQKNGDEVVQ